MKILAEFRDGRTAVYTYGIFELLCTDKNVVKIIDMKTGRRLK